MDPIESLVLQFQQEGILDEQFQQLMQLQDETNPNFVEEVVQLYFEDSGTKIDKIAQMLQGLPDYNELDQLVHQFKGSSASLGAQQIAQLCIKLRESCQSQNREMCVFLLQQIQEAYRILKNRLELFLREEAKRKQAHLAGH
mmetsp:Transcript_36652/g.81569  ORF Transcript_36652/g.81569 Transcript_36652/m.81569 type:complete len:142 (-) Transcript_36652:807-1232(-)|eukprot:CAMPEP_0202892638 /NCGR_PEP_ID=MMETSP1392-20130828/2349_1 /ASSEMBLY_ACC=CAM_ASM_000868 /TAXON_ID=225041 /ORGANISM="Chlamydomonas chlamydogama, Strain SAG 11-48b" /LENGTH=141 /DNA_ID=CAMNT_0049576673 /DNA_START=363 /DNA_END=788 /DNA_ORIENTATION=-